MPVTPQPIFKDIRQKIIDIINSSAVSKIEIAYKTDRSTFEGFPAAIVSPSDNDADYGDSANEMLSVGFKVRVYYPIKEESDNEPAELALEEAIDELMTVFRNRSLLNPAADYVEPVPSVWVWETRGEGVYRMAELTLRCKKYVSQQ